MNIVYTTNELFVSKVATSICSVFENNKEEDSLRIFIIGQGLSEDSHNKYDILGKKYNREIQIIKLDELQDYFDFDFDTGGWNPIVLARLLLERLLPGDVDRVIYLDGDTVNVGSLGELWNINMNNKCIGACIEATVDEKHRRALGMENVPYVNAGVLLIDLRIWEEEQAGKVILDYYKKNNGRLSANDQDAINGAMKGQIFFLNPKYNFYNIYWFYPYRILKKLMGSVYYYSQREISDACMCPKIIHYLGEERPWRKGNKHKYRADYEKYLKKTPWKGEKQEEGWEVYFVFWNIFNFLIKPFPSIRYHIINKLIPVVMKWRSKQLKKTNDIGKGK